MKRLRLKATLLSLICLALLLNLNLTANAADKKPKVLQPQAIGTATLKANVSATVNNVVLIPSNNGQQVGLTVTFKNNSNADINFIDYWVTLNTKSGTKYSLTIVNKDVSKIAAKSTKDIMFYGQVGSSVKLTDLVVKIIRWDFSAPNYTKVLGSFSPTVKYSQVTPAGSARVVNAEDTQISFFVKKSNVGKSEKYYRPDLSLVIRNEGKKAITLPDYEMAIQTSDGLLYPLTVKDLKGKVLSPLSEEEFQLSTSIPLEAKESNWRLVVTSPINEGKDKLPLALFNLPKATIETIDGIGKTYTFINADGVYNIKVDSINRLPMEDNDLVISNITLINKGNKSLVIPQLTGKYLFNSSIKKEITIHNGNKQIDIEPGQEIRLQAIAKVPYTFDINKIKFTLQQKETGGSNEELIDLVEFTTDGQISPISKTSWKDGFKIEEAGSKADVKVKHLMRYDGVNADMAVVLLTINSEEKRLAIMQQLAGYFQQEDGAVYPATFMNVTDKINASGKALVYAWASIPKGTKVNGMHLIVGKAVTEAKEPVNGQASPSEVMGYVDPVDITLPAEREALPHLQNMDLDPFTLSINQVSTSIRFDQDLLKLWLDYTLEQDLLTKVNAKDQKLIVELVDADHKAVFSKEFSFPSGDPENKEEGALKNGVNRLETSWTDDRWVLNIQVLKDMTFNVYHQIQPGYKKLIASQQIPWLVNRKLPAETK